MMLNKIAKLVCIFLFLLQSTCIIGQENSFYPFKKEFIDLSNELYIKTDNLIYKHEGAKKSKLFSDTIIGSLFSVKSTLQVTNCEWFELDGAGYNRKRCHFDIMIFDDSDRRFRNHMINEVIEYYDNKRDSFHREHFQEIDSTFIVKSFVLSPNGEVYPYYTNDHGDGTWILISLGTKIIRVELKNYRYPKKHKCKNRYPLRTFMLDFYINQYDDSFSLFKASYGSLSYERRKYYESGKLKVNIKD